MAEPQSTNVLSYPCSNQDPFVSTDGFSPEGVHSVHARARAQNFRHNFGRLYGPIRATTRFSPWSILTLALADSHRGLGLNGLLSLPLAPPVCSGGHRYTQGQDGQQQRPGPRTPEHLETVQGQTPSPGGKVSTSWIPFRNPQEESLPVPPGGGGG